MRAQEPRLCLSYRPFLWGSSPAEHGREERGARHGARSQAPGAPEPQPLAVDIVRAFASAPRDSRSHTVPRASRALDGAARKRPRAGRANQKRGIQAVPNSSGRTERTRGVPCDPILPALQATGRLLQSIAKSPCNGRRIRANHSRIGVSCGYRMSADCRSGSTSYARARSIDARPCS